MDAFQIFKQLSRGAKFSSKSQLKINSRPQIVKKEDLEPVSSRSVSEEPPAKVAKRKPSSQDDPLKIFDDLITYDDDKPAGKKSKKKKTPAEKLEKEKIAHLRNIHHISVIGKDVPAPLEQFDVFTEKYQLNERILKNLYKCGYSSPTPIQMQAVPLMLENRQVLACAPTGSGKTAAFLIPIIHHMLNSNVVKKPTGIRAVIVCPTRELSSQIFRECQQIGYGLPVKTILISKISHVREKFNPKALKKYDILVTTPNRLVYLLKQDPPMVSLKKVEWLIVDECDKLFEEGIRGFRDQLAVIYNACDAMQIKRAMFSATQSPHLTKWCRKNLKRLVTINIGVRNSACSDVDQELLFVGNESGKLIAFRDLVRQGLTPPVLVFVQSKERAQELFNELIYDGINVDIMHSDRSQAQRENVVRCFREGKIWVLICTELMSRGVDFKGVNLVVNYDFPPSTVAYIHRIGRTGRAGRRGRAITYFTLDDVTNLRSIAHVVKESGSEVPEFLLTLKKPKKEEKRLLELRAPERERISTTPVYEELLQKRKENAIKKSKRKKNFNK